MTARYAVIGDPVAHSLSPVMQTAAFRAAGIDASYELLHVSRDDLAVTLDRLREGFAGFNITTPLKEAVLPHLDALTDLASEAQSSNTVRVDKHRFTGHNTDGAGFVAAVAERWHITPRGKSVCLLGSGPAARAIAHAVRKAGAGSVTCWSRNPLTSAEIGPPPAGAPNLLVSALPRDAVVPDEILETVSAAAYVFDLNYGSGRSPVPSSIGAHRTDGLPMLLHQGALSFQWWTGAAPPLDAMRAALTQGIEDM